MNRTWLRAAGMLLGGLGAACAILSWLGQQGPIAAAPQVQIAAGPTVAQNGLLISAVHVGLPGWDGQDEAFQIANPAELPVVLTGSLQIVNQTGHVLTFPPTGYTLEPGARIWCARNAYWFAAAFGFLPAFEYGQDSMSEVPNLSLNPSFVVTDRRGSLTLQQLERVDVANPTGGPWPAGSNDDKSSMERRDPTLEGEVENWADSTVTTVGLDRDGAPILGTPHYTNSTYIPARPTGVPAVVINEVAWAGTAASHYDEWIELYNNMDQDLNLDGWLLASDDESPSVQLEGVIQARGFFLLERTADDTISNMTADQIYVGSLKNTGEALALYRAEILDVVVYGPGEEAQPGWIGPPLQFYVGGSTSIEGQILFRKYDSVTGILWPDTDHALDWANDTSPGRLLYGPVNEGDLYGKRVMYPGWEATADRTRANMLAPTLPSQAAAPAPAASSLVTVAVAPDNAYAVLADHLARAQQEILVGGYTFDSVWLTGVLTERIRAGVQVTMLLEGGPAGGLSEATLWNSAQIVNEGGHVYFVHHDPGAAIYSRYRNHHAKYLIVDGRWVAVGSENFGNHGMPVDDKANGTAGDRGIFMIAEEPDVVSQVREVFAWACDPARHNDIVAYGQLLRYTVPPTYTAVYSPGGGGYDYLAPFSATLPGMDADRLTVLSLPKTNMSHRDGLLGLVLQAGRGDRVDVEQMSEAHHWGPAESNADLDPNPRLEAYIQAARNGARVRILLDSGLDKEGRNRETAFYLTELAQHEDLALEARLGNPTQRGIHNKMVLVDLGSTERYVHVGSINGSEMSNKANRELALQLRSSDVHSYLQQVFEYDWMHSSGVFDLWLPTVYNESTRESDHVVISEVVFKLSGEAEQGEWIELYNPTPEVVDLGGWQLGDAVHPGDYERRYAFPAETTIAPQGTLVIARQAIVYQRLAYETQAKPDLEWLNSDETPNLIRTTWGEGEFLLGNSGDEVLLVDPQNRLVDALVYGNGDVAGTVPFSDLDAVYNGNSLERLPANRDSDDCDRDFRVRYTPAPGATRSW